MTGKVHVKEPAAFTEDECREFERLVREGFEGSDEGLPVRIRDARSLAFYYTADDTLAGIAGLKAPNTRCRGDVFKEAGAQVDPAHYRFELGWVFVVPGRRGGGIAEHLCRLLLTCVPLSGVFATTRANNKSMIRILVALGFVRVGKPFPRRREELVLFLRPEPGRGHPPRAE